MTGWWLNWRSASLIMRRSVDQEHRTLKCSVSTVMVSTWSSSLFLGLTGTGSIFNWCSSLVLSNNYCTETSLESHHLMFISWRLQHRLGTSPNHDWDKIAAFLLWRISLIMKLDSSKSQWADVHQLVMTHVKLKLAHIQNNGCGCVWRTSYNTSVCCPQHRGQHCW